MSPPHQGTGEMLVSRACCWMPLSSAVVGDVHMHRGRGDVRWLPGAVPPLGRCEAKWMPTFGKVDGGLVGCPCIGWELLLEGRLLDS